MTQLKGFKVKTTLVLVIIKIESEDKIKYDTFSSNSKAEIMINENDILMMRFNQSILQLYQTYKNC